MLKAPSPVMKVVLPYLVLNEEGENKEGYEEPNAAARLFARSYGLPLKEYISSEEWNPDDCGVDP